MPSISLVVPAFNEQAALPYTVARCVQVLERTGQEYEIIMLDDASTDGTWQIMQSITAQNAQNIRALRHESNQGIAKTFEDLYHEASKDFVFLIPADGEYPPEALIDCLPLIDRGADIVICARSTKYYTVYRQFISYAYRALTARLFGIDLIDPGSIKCIRRSIIAETPVRCVGVYVEVERVVRAVRAGYRYAVVPITAERRTGGRARGARLCTVVQAVKDLLSLWLELGYRKADASACVR